MQSADLPEQGGCGVQALIYELQRILFEVRETTPRSGGAAGLMLGNQPPEEAIATLVDLSAPRTGRTAPVDLPKVDGPGAAYTILDQLDVLTGRTPQAAYLSSLATEKAR